MWCGRCVRLKARGRIASAVGRLGLIAVRNDPMASGVASGVSAGDWLAIGRNEDLFARIAQSRFGKRGRLAQW